MQWSQFKDPELRQAYTELPGEIFAAARWFADRGTGVRLRLITTFQYRPEQDPVRLLALNLFAPDLPSTYLYYLPFLITAECYTGLQPLFSRDGYLFYDAISTLEYISLIEQMLLDNQTTGDPEGNAAIVFTAGDCFKKQRLRALGSSSNTMLLVDQSYLLKNYRRIYPGQNPELRMGLALTRLGSELVSQVQGAFSYFPEGSASALEYTLGLALERIEHLGTGWEIWGRMLQNGLRAECEETLLQAEALGETIAGLHREMLQVARDQNRWAHLDPAMIEARGEKLRTTLRRELAVTNPELAGIVLQKVERLIAGLTAQADLGVIFRTHGDLHLEQVLKTPTGWKVIDFEGEPLKTIEEREYYDSPMKDLASLLRSISYRVNTLEPVVAPLEFRLAEALKRGYLQAYQRLQGDFLPQVQVLEGLISLFELERAVYEYIYESNYRPDWVRIPLAGLQKLLGNEKEEH